MAKPAKKKAAKKTVADKKSATSAKKKTTAVEKRKSTAVATPVNMTDLKKMGGKGLEMAKGDSECYAIAFLKILQDLSPEIKKGEAQLDDAEVGDIMNTVTKELFGEDGVYLVPCFFERAMVEWIPQNDGGGFVGKYDKEHPIVRTAVKDDKGRMKLPNGHELQDTRYHYCLLAKKVGKSWSFTAVIVPMASTQIKASRNWVNLMAELLEDDDDGGKFTPPTFATMYQLTTGHQENKVGQSWYGWQNIKYIGLIIDNGVMFAAAQALYDMASSGVIQAQTDGVSSVDDSIIDEADVPM